MAEAYIVDAVRTPVGRRGGGLAAAHPADLGAHVISALLARTGLDPLAVDDVVFGCVDTIGPQAGDIARTAWLAAGLPEEVPGVTVDRQCGSSQQAVHFAAQAVLSGTAHAVVAGGVQNMSQIPIAAAMLAGQQYGFTDPFGGSSGWAARYGRSGDFAVPRRGHDRPGSGTSAARRWRATRWPATSARRRPSTPAISRPRSRPTDRLPSTSARAATLRWRRWPACRPLREDGLITAALSSQIADAAAAVLVVSEQALTEHGLTPRARIHHLSARGADPVLMLTAPIPATAHALKLTGLSIGQIDLVEINEAFASVVLAWQRETGADLDRVNVCGGAIALGHPLGATGARLLTTLLSSLERTGGRYGLLTMCEGGGQANVTVIERL